MKISRRLVVALLLVSTCLTPLGAIAEDIDIFTGLSAGTNANPNILIVLDNTSNWARQSQQWPGGLQQGQSEVRSIKNLINDSSNIINSNVNLGLMEFVVNGTANDDGGYIRFAIQPMTDAAKTVFSSTLTTAYNNITDPTEKRNSNTAYGDLMYDVYNYFAGGNTLWAQTASPALNVDNHGYTSNYTVFKSPLTANDGCSRTFMVFIGNPNASGPASDSAANTSALADLEAANNADTSAIPLPYFQTTVINNATVTLGTTTACYSSQTAAQAAYGYGLNSADNLCQLYAATTGTATAATDSAGQSCNAYSGTTLSSSPSDFKTQCASYTQGCSIGNPLNSTSTQTASGWTSYLASTPSGTSAGAAAGLTCPANAVSGTCFFTVDTTSGSATSPITSTNSGNETAETTTCYAPAGTATADIPSGAYAFPGGSPVTYTSGSTATLVANVGLNSTLAASLFTSSCVLYGSDGTCTLTCPANTQCAYSWALDGNKSLPGTGTGNCPMGTGRNLVQSFPMDVKLTPAKLTKYHVTMTYQIPDPTNGCADPSQNHYEVKANNTQLATAPTGTTFTDTKPLNADDWARFMHQADVNPSALGGQNVTTYTIDVYNKQPNATQTSLLLSMAQRGGGRYFSATNETEILNALKQIVAEIQSVNTAFAAASIPLSTSNRTQNLNQVFIGMFRADAMAQPRWMGNLKEFQIGTVNGLTDLVDQYGNSANNSQTGFLSDCATSFWTSDSSEWWHHLVVAMTPSPRSPCLTMPSANTSAWSDLPDGSSVEKGAVAEVLRKGGNPPLTNSAPTWNVNRTLYSRIDNAFVTFNTTNTTLDSNTVNFISGVDINVPGVHTSEMDYSSIISPLPAAPARPSIHGDVVHSRPLAIDYGGTTGVVVYYGSNDGTYRAVSANTGKELWAFIAPEFDSRLSRLMTNLPLIAYPNVDMTITPTPTRKDYFFDGSAGLRQNADNSAVWIYPTQRRGGRMVYGLDVTTPTAPTIKWHQGCETNQTATGNDTNCTAGFSDIGQTWATPVVARIKGYSTTTPVVVVGGGYDTCEDADTTPPLTTACPSPKGRFVYIIDADTGVLIKSFATARGVTADVSMIDIDNDGYVDYAYAADLGGNIYRISFVESPTAPIPLAPSLWERKRVAYAGDGIRKFMFAPALAYGGSGSVYVALGSGDREHPLYSNYPYANVLNRAYTYLDALGAYNVDPTACNLDGDPSAGDACVVDYSAATTCDTQTLLPGNAIKSWRVNMLPGEQVVTPALIVGGLVTFNTNRPLPPAQATCNKALGEAGGYFLNLLNASGAIGVSGTCDGTRRGTFVEGIGLPTPPVLVNVAGKPPIIIGGIDRTTGSDSKLFSPSEMPPPISKTRHQKYRYKVIDQ